MSESQRSKPTQGARSGKPAVAWVALASTLLLALQPVEAVRASGRDRSSFSLPPQESHLPLPQSLNEAWRWATFTVVDGLPDGEVKGIVADPEGVTWVATERGVAWFDGYRWNQPEPTVEDELPGIRSLMPGKNQGVRFIAGGHLHAADSDGLRQVKLPPSLDSESINDAACGPDGALIIRRGRELALLSNDGVVTLEVPGTKDGQLKLGLSQASNGSIWLRSRAGLHTWRDGAWLQRLALQGHGRTLEMKEAIEDPHGNGLVSVIASGTEAGLWEWGSAKGSTRAHSEGRGHIAAFAMRDDGLVLAAHDDGTVRLKSEGSWVTVSPTPQPMQDITYAKFMANGDLWLGTTNGISLHASGAQRWQSRNHPFPDGRNRVLELLRTRDGSLWLGTAQGVEVLHPDGRITQHSRIKDRALGAVTALGQDIDGNVWVGSGDLIPGAYRVDGERWQHLGAAEGLTDMRIHRISRDRQGRLWFLGLDELPTHDGPGAFVLEDGLFAPWGREQGLLSGRVYAMDQDSSGRLWFATIKGVSSWSAGKWRHWTKREGLKEQRVFTLKVDRDDRVWFGHQYRYGVGHIDSQGRVSYVTTEQGLIGNSVWEVEADGVGGLWVATREGLSHLVDGTWSRLARAEGLPAQRIWPILAEHDRVHVGTWGAGLASLDLEAARVPAPRVFIEDPVVSQSGAHLRWRPAAWQGSTPSECIDTRYRVADGEWSPWSRDRQVTFESLPGLVNRVEVQAKGLIGDGHGPCAMVTVELMPPVWQRTEFWIPMGSLLLILTLLGAAWRVRRLRDRASIQNLQERLVQAAKLEAVGRLAGGIAHDFNNLLTVIMGSSAVLRAELPPGSDSAEQLGQIDLASDRATKLTTQLLTFARKRPVAPRVIYMEDLIARFAGILRRVIGENVLLDIEAPDSPWPVCVDTGQFEQILTNLAVNARDSMPSGGQLRITTRRVPAASPELEAWPQLRDRPCVELSISDDGCGMDEATLARVFEPFFTTKGVGKGTGLGLAMMHGIVQQAGGEVAVQSQPGVGTTFRILLPRADGPVQSLPSRSQRPGPAPGHETLLLVEDEPAVRQAATLALEGKGYKLLTAESGQEALQVAGRHEGSIELLLTDVVMPGLSGPELAGRLHVSHPETKVLYMSGYAEESVLKEANVPTGCFLAKPFTPSGLCRQVRQVLDPPSQSAPAAHMSK